MNDIQQIINRISAKGWNEAAGKGHKVNVHYINNRDGSVRWIWPCGARHPLFLKCYHVQGWRSQLVSWAIQLVFALRLPTWVFRRVSVAGNFVTDRGGATNWALFTGTTGPNQKYVLYTADEKGEGVFTKIAISNRAAALIATEYSVLQQLDSSVRGNWAYPQVVYCDTQFFSVAEAPQYVHRVNTFTPHHAEVLATLRTLGNRTLSFEAWNRALDLDQRLAHLTANRAKTPAGIVKKLGLLYQRLREKSVEVHLAHGDFTPWNMYANQRGALYLYDWELARHNYPKGFDFFHFFVQKGVLLTRTPWQQIRREIETHAPSFFENDEKEHCLSLYLFTNVLNYLEIYEQQAQWHPQIYWLLETWNMAMSDVLRPAMPPRELVVLDVFDGVHHQPYAGLKLPAGPLEKLSLYSDLDLLLSKKDTRALLTQCQHHPLVNTTKVQSGTAMTKVTLHLADDSILSLDCIHQLKRRHVQYMSVPQMIQAAETDTDGIRRVNEADTQRFIGLFYGLNKAHIPNQYRQMPRTVQTDNALLNQVLHQQFTDGQPRQPQLLKIIQQWPENRGFSRVRHWLTYLSDTGLQLLRHRGMVITFSGVDGAGKSTIIETTKRELEKKLRKRVVVIRHRPSLLPILSAWTKGKAAAEKVAADHLPRQGTNKSRVSSLFRFLYYYSDYLLGQFWVYLRYVVPGKVVLYDRYYFDFIHDSRRSNIELPKWLPKMGYTLLLQPHLNFFLYADAPTILRRKQELDATTIEHLTKNYLDLFQQLGRKRPAQYYTINNICLDQTTTFITRKIQSKLV